MWSVTKVRNINIKNKKVKPFKGGVFFLPGVIIKDGEPFEKAFKRFKRLCEKEKIRSEIKKHQHFEKPSEKRQRKRKEAGKTRRSY
jgi:small subunit ribosomal protein S21